MDRPCPFCAVDAGRVIARTPATIALWDAFPVAVGHALVVPVRHVASVFALTSVEQAALWAEVARVRDQLAAELGVDAFTVGTNDGALAGQTVPHAHVHVIPRRSGDVMDPRGGLRWVIPDRADYWSRR